MKTARLFLKRKLVMLTLVSFALTLSGCASTWVQKAPKFQPKKSTPVLMGHYQVTNNGGADLIDLAKQGAGGNSLAKVGRNTYKMMKKSLMQKFSLNLKTDRRRSKKLNHGIDLTSGDKKTDELIGSIAGQWTHPDGADNPFHRILAGTNLRKQVVNTIKGRNQKEVFLSANLKIEDQDQWMVMKRFRLILSIQILDQKGEAIFQAKAEGFSGLKFLRNPISDERIETAMASALANLEKAEIEGKISTLTTL
jgi:hypothetical protein